VPEAVPICRSIKTNGKGKQALGFDEAATVIAQALAIPHQAAGMLLYGLAATGNVRTLDDELDPIDEDKCTISELGGSIAYVSAEDIRRWLGDWSVVSQPSHRETVIAAMLPRTVPWKQFCNDVRNACRGWKAKGKPALGFGDKQIQRIVKNLRQR
jgi:hypothetical protein